MLSVDMNAVYTRNAPWNMNEKWPADLENAPVVRGFIEPRMWYWLFALSGA